MCMRKFLLDDIQMPSSSFPLLSNERANSRIMLILLGSRNERMRGD